MTALREWADAVQADSRVLLIVNSQPSDLPEIERAVDSIGGRCPLSSVRCIAPAGVRSWLIGRGIAASNILDTRLRGLDVELAYFLESDRAIRWAAAQQPTLVVMTEPYAPNNEEVKHELEQRVAALMGSASLVVHSLPDDHVFVLDVEEIWRRAVRQDANVEHQVRVHHGLDRLKDDWKAGTTPRLDELERIMSGAPVSADRPPVIAAAQRSYQQVHNALRAGGAEGLKVVVEPAGARPRAGWLAERVEPVTRPAQLAYQVRWHRSRLVVRATAGDPYAYLLASRARTLQPGDAAVAEGRVYRGGVTIGLVSGDRWAARVDIDEPGSFLAAAVATTSAPHTLVIANCLKGEERRTAVVLSRFGWARQTR